MDSNVLAGRILVMALAILIGALVAFKTTPELNGVKNAFRYRLAYSFVVIRAVTFVLIDLCGLFPI